MQRIRKIFLTIFSYVYAGGIAMRNFLFDNNIFRAHDVGIPVISIGNVTVGGTGKTPIVEMLLRYFLAQKKNVAVVTRGYKRSTKGMHVVSDGEGNISTASAGGDEPVQIARKFPSIVVIADEKRVRGCTYARNQFRVEVILLDDGFQHRACSRDLDIVVIDASRAPEGQSLLPLGRLREPLRNLRRADVVILSKCADADQAASAQNFVTPFTQAPVFATRFVPGELHAFPNRESFGAATIRDKRIVAFCGIGSPESFEHTLQQLGCTVTSLISFADHHAYTATDVEAILAQYREREAAAILTTEKDAMRLETHVERFRDISLLYPVMSAIILADAEKFYQYLEESISQSPHTRKSISSP